MKYKIIIGVIVLGLIVGTIYWFGRAPKETTLTANEKAMVEQINVLNNHINLIENYLLFENPAAIEAYNAKINAPK